MAQSKRGKRKKKIELVAQEAADAALDSAALLAYAQPVLTELTKDLLERADGSEAITAAQSMGGHLCRSGQAPRA